jgi:hypothetical protein
VRRRASPRSARRCSPWSAPAPVRQRLPEAGAPPAGDVLFEVVTGFVDSDSAFAAHGHVLRIRVAEA